MMTETPRAGFLGMVSQLSPGTWSAVVLLIPPEWLHKRKIAGDEADQIVASGVKILRSLDDGIYARISWCAYFAVCRKAVQQTASTLKEEIAKAGLDDERFGLWRFSVQPLTSSPGELFEGMGIGTHKRATADAGEPRASNGN
ncbi:MAG TPA: hypothetical protein VIX73_00640 [Kofleriaceae bacterium]|jgi:hypothetical protein